MVSYQGIMVTAGLSQFSTEEQSPLPGPPEIFWGPRRAQSYLFSHSSIFWWEEQLISWHQPTGEWVGCSHSFSQSTMLISQVPTWLLCLLFLLWHWAFCVSLWRISVFHFLQALPAAVSPLPTLTVPWKLLLRHFLLCQPSLETFPFFSSKAGPTALWLSCSVTGRHPWLL